MRQKKNILHCHSRWRSKQHRKNLREMATDIIFFFHLNCTKIKRKRTIKGRWRTSHHNHRQMIHIPSSIHSHNDSFHFTCPCLIHTNECLNIIIWECTGGEKEAYEILCTLKKWNRKKMRREDAWEEDNRRVNISVWQVCMLVSTK